MARPLEFAAMFAIGLTGSSLLTILPTVYRPLIGSVVMAGVMAAIVVTGTLLWAWATDRRGVFATTVAVAIAIATGVFGGVLWLLW